jgi:predicted HD superfamily hydrolase involved in NAD metabolism
MSKIFGLSEEDSYTLCAAALLHDIAKTLPMEKALLLAEKQGKTLNTDIPTVIHQYTGAMLALEDFGSEFVNDEMLSAIECHTTGKVNMTPLDKMLFVADFTEAGRKYRSCMEFREYLHSGCEKINKNDKNARYGVLDDVTKRIVGYTITYLTEKGRKIAPPMIEAWNSMV